MDTKSFIATIMPYATSFAGLLGGAMNWMNGNAPAIMAAHRSPYGVTNRTKAK